MLLDKRVRFIIYDILYIICFLLCIEKRKYYVVIIINFYKYIIEIRLEMIIFF